MDELFSRESQAALEDLCDVGWGRDEPIGDGELAKLLPDASFLVATRPKFTASAIDTSPHLRAVIEVAGSFPPSIDYAACEERGIEVLSCAPAFRHVVAEMAIAMALAAARGVVEQHELFRRGEEQWLADGDDFSLFGAPLGFVGFGSIAREIARLLTPMGPSIKAYDPWANEAIAAQHGATLTTLEEVMKHARCLFVAAAPSPENAGMIGREALAHLPSGAIVVLISRAHLVDFDAVVDAARGGKIRLATDVYPQEPLASDHELRRMPGVILSPHRGAAVRGGRQLIGEMIVADMARILSGETPTHLQRAMQAPNIAKQGTGDLPPLARVSSADDPSR